MTCLTVLCECGVRVGWYRRHADRTLRLCEHKTPSGTKCPNSLQQLAALKAGGKVK